MSTKSIHYLPIGVSRRDVSRKPSRTNELHRLRRELGSALEHKTLPPVAHEFMAHVHSGNPVSAPTEWKRQATLKSIPLDLAKTLVSLTTPTGVRNFVAKMLLADPELAQKTINSLGAPAPDAKAVITTQHATDLHTALNSSVHIDSPVPLIKILLVLPFSVAQAILNNSEAASQMLFAGWRESIDKQAALNAAAAKKKALRHTEMQSTQRRSNELARANAALGQQKQRVAQIAHKRAVLRRASAAAFIEASFARQERTDLEVFERTCSPELAVPTEPALLSPRGGIGPQLGLKGPF